MYVYEKDTGNKIPAGMCSVTLPTEKRILSIDILQLYFYNEGNYRDTRLSDERWLANS